MTKEELLEHREDLVQKLEQTKANFHAYEGALQECDYWLAQFDSDDSTE